MSDFNVSEKDFDSIVEKAFISGIEFQKKKQLGAEKIWFDIGYNAALKTHGLLTGDILKTE